MATIKPVVLAQNIREDGLYKVVYRLTHKRKSRYLSTSHYVGPEDIGKDGDIKMDFVLEYLSDEIKSYRSKISRISDKIDRMDVDDVKKHITLSDKGLPFIPYMEEWIERLRERREVATVKAYETVLNLIMEVYPSGIDIQDINRSTIREVVSKCKEREIENHVANIYVTKFKKVFIDARKHYNDIDSGLILIPNNPFEYWDPLPTNVKIKKKAIPIEHIRMIRDYRSKVFGIASKTFMLTIYLCGINFIDLFLGCEKFLESDIVEYNRRKSKSRKDSAFIRMKKTPEIQKLLEDFVKVKREMKSKENMHNKVRRNLKRVAEDLELDYNLTLYHGRHSFATIARNDCGFSKDDVADALNHIDDSRRVTDIYIKKDFENVYRVQDAVINKINEDILKS